MSWLRRKGKPAADPATTRDATEADVLLAYRLILKRDPDVEGHAHYSARVRAGMSVRDLVSGLLESDEYRERSQKPGTASPRPEPELAAPADLIDPKEVIRTYSIEQLLETADEYYRRVDDPTPLMSKPFTFLHEAPEMLENMGLLLAGLYLGKTMTVLDFGAGTCWLSRCLAQLNCRPVCCDSSRAALEIGRKLFDEYPLIGRAVYAPTFVPFDGHRLDIESGSIDRIVCFDAFHHIPNQETVIREFSRVLKAGGIAGFSEPGRNHARSPQSQYEMRNHRVLENNIDLKTIADLALAAGFTDVRVKILNDLSTTVQEYDAMCSDRDAGSLRDAVWDATLRTTFNRTIFFLHKGPIRRDSRSHVGLAHKLTTKNSHVSVPIGEPARLSLELTNTGEATWLHENVEIFGVVRLGSHLYEESGRLLEVDHSRHELPSQVEPGQTIELHVSVPLPARGAYRLGFDLVAEGVTWFENVGSTPLDVVVRREAQ